MTIFVKQRQHLTGKKTTLDRQCQCFTDSVQCFDKEWYLTKKNEQLTVGQTIWQVMYRLNEWMNEWMSGA